MRIVSSAWISGSLAAFEAACCLNTHAALGLATETMPFDIYILDGYEKLTPDFTHPLAEKHIRLHDVGGLAKAYLKQHKKLFELFGSGQGAVYEIFCFLRWLVLEDKLAGEPFLHIDTDLFFQIPFDDVAANFHGLSGTFGSPCLTSVDDYQWLRTYRQALNDLIADRSAFQTAIGYGGNEFRSDISSDQDLVRALELADLLPPRGLAPLFNSFEVFINPLWPYQDKPARAREHKIINGIDTIDGKPVLFWHLQNNFADYVSRFAAVSDYEQTWLQAMLPVKLNLPFIQLAPSAENFAFQALRDMAWERIMEVLARSGSIYELGRERYFSRTWVSEWFILHRKGRGLFSAACWWEDGVFRNNNDGGDRTVENQAALEVLNRLVEPIHVHDRDHILQLINLCKLTGEAVEVGTFNGTFANELLEKTEVSKLSCVDPYVAYDDFKDAINGMDIEEIFAQAKRFLSRYIDRVAFVREFSEPASHKFADNSLDLVYIDGNHQSAYVMIDLKAWWPKVRAGGLVIGDDCVDLDDGARNDAGDITFVHRRRHDGTPDLYGDYGVLHALRNFAVERSLGYLIMGSQFVIPK